MAKQAKLEAVITANIHPLEKAFAEVRDKARELGKGMTEVGSDLGKGLTGIDLGKLLGIGGAVYAAGKLGEALVDAAKEGYKAFQEFQDAALRFKYKALDSAGSLEERGKKGTEMAESVEGKVGAFNFDSLSKAATSLEMASAEFRESPEKLNSMLDNLIALALKSGSAPDAIAEQWRKLVVGIKEEGGAAVGKFFKATPGLEAETEKLRAKAALDYLKGQGLSDVASGSEAQQDRYNTIANTPIDEFMTQLSGKIGGTAVLEEIKGILERSAPKEITGDYAKNHPMDALKAGLEKIHVMFGEKITPAINDFIAVLVKSMPVIADDFKALAEIMADITPLFTVLAQVISGVNLIIAEFAKAVGGWLGQKYTETGGGTDTQRSVDAKLKTMGMDSASMLQGNARSRGPTDDEANYTGGLYFGGGAATESGEDKQDAIDRAQSEKRASAADAAKKEQIRASAEHDASVARIALQASQSSFQEQTRGAVRSTMSQVDPTDHSEQERRYADQQASAVKIINIQAEAAAKIRTLNEESAVKTAKINEEIALRNVTRAAEDVKKDELSPRGQEDRKAARLAEDAASKLQIDDLHAEAAQLQRDADLATANKIIDEQEASAQKQRDIIVAAYDAAVAKHEGPFKFTPDQSPAQVDTYSKFGKGGQVIEGSYERRQREEANRAGQAAVDKQNEQYQKQKEQTALAGVRGVKYDQSGVGAALNITAGYDPKTGAKSDSNPNFDFSKGATEQAKGTLVLEAIYKAISTLTGVLTS